jgi:cobalt-zinc-cadmium efflux system outer membrane protein
VWPSLAGGIVLTCTVCWAESSPPQRPDLSADSPPPARLNLDEAIQEALAHAPDLGAACEAIAQARADLRTVSLVPNPQLNAGTTLQHLPGGQFTASNPGGPPQYNIDLAQPVDTFLFGKRTAAMESARRAVEVATADVDDLKRQRIGAVASGFFDVLEARALLDLSRVDLEDLRRVEGLIRRRVDLGGATKVDLDRAQLAAAVAAQDLRTAETTHAGALASLRALIGRGNAEPGFDVVGSLDVVHTEEAPGIEQVLELAEAARPSLISLRQQIEHWEAETRSQKRQAFPTVEVQLGWVYQHQEPIGARDFSEWEAAVTTSLPVFDRNQGNIAKAESQARQARQTLAAARVALLAEITQAVAAFRGSAAAVVAADPLQLQAAQQVRDRMEAAYREGGRTILEVLDAEHAYREARRLHVHAQSSYWHALYQLNAVAGAPVLNTGGQK